MDGGTSRSDPAASLYGSVGAAAAITAVLFVIAQFMWAPARLHRQILDERETLHSKLSACEQRWEPQLEIIDGSGQPFEQRQDIRLADGVELSGSTELG